MTNNEISAYQRLQSHKSSDGVLRRLRQVDLSELVEYGVLLLLSRATIFGGASPFGLAFFAATFPKQKRVYGLVFICAGILLGNFGILSLKYLGAAAIVATFSLLLGAELDKRRWLYGLIASLAVGVCGMICVFFDGMLLYDLLLLLIESISTFLCFFAFLRAAALLRLITKRTVLENEETLSLVLLSAAVILSISSFEPFAGAAHVLSALIIMLLSLTGGAAASTMAGALLGLVISMGNVLPAQTVGVYSICAMVSGLLRRFGKWGVALGFLFTNAAVVLYFNSSTVTFIPFYYILFAAALLFFLPDRFLSLFGAVARTPGLSSESDPVARTRAALDAKLSEASDSFAELSGILKKLVEHKVKSDVCEVGPVFEKTAEKVCVNCSMNRYCWQKNYNATMGMLSDMLPLMRERGRAVDVDAPKSFRDSCARFEDFIAVLNKNYAIYRVNLMWAGKVMESRTLVAEQFRTVASVLTNIRATLSADITQNMQLENKIAAALDRKGITADQIRVSDVNGYDVTMLAAACGENRICSTTAAAAVSEALGVPMLRVGRRCGERVCKLRFREQERFSVDVGLAQAARGSSEPSGDSHTFSLLGNGKYILALSDGMGSGARANAQSGVAVELIRRLLEAGFDKDTALRLINSILLTDTDDESFVTVDMCLVDLYSGALEFIKIGAAPSFVAAAGSVERIDSSSLPAGIVDKAEPDRSFVKAQNGSFIALLTDGVTDAFSRAENGFLEKMLSRYSGSAQQLADTLLLEAIKLSGGRVRDDMTALCARISEVM